jgi:Undecaprenyl-phosphate galactose phosphotransferase WbaP
LAFNEELSAVKSVESHAKVDDKRQATRSSEAAAVETALAAHTHDPLSLAWDVRYLLQNMRTALPLVACDQLVLVGAVQVATRAIQAFDASLVISMFALNLSLGCGLLIAFVVGELYPGVGLPPVVEVRQCSVSIKLVFAVYLLATLFHGAPGGTTAILIVTWLICLIFIPVCRFLIRRFCCRFRWWMQPALIFGNAYERRKLHRALETRPYLGLSPIGILDDIHAHWGSNGDDANYIGPPGAALEISRQRGVYRAIVAMPEQPKQDVHQAIKSTFDWFPHLLVLPKEQGLPLLWAKGWDFAGHSGFQSKNRLLLPLPRLAKRLMDVAVVFVAGLLLVPLVLVIAIAIKCSSPGPIFYRQQRVGRGGRRFRTWKFRTMVVGAEEILSDYLQRHPELKDEWEEGHKLKNDPRVIPWIGRWLRRSSMDELPQLWNVLVGEMSLVGPRPLPQYHLDQFDEEFRRYREKITPGMTGMWQVASRKNNAPERFVRWDGYYIRNWSIWLDLRIIFLTLKVVISGDGAY